MIKRLIILLIIFPFQISAQQRISINKDCIVRNEAFLAKKLLELFGESKVKELLDNKIRVAFDLTVSIKGETKIRSVRSFVEQDTTPIPMSPSKKKSLDDILPDLKSKVVFAPGYFILCFEKLTNDKEDVQINGIKNEINLQGGTVSIIVDFPDHLLQVEYGTKELSSVEKIKLLKKQIAQYCN